MSYKTSKSNILMGDGGIDLIGEHRVEDYQIIPPDTLGIFVTTIGYTESSVYDILLVNISNLIKQFTLYVNRKIKKHSSDDSDIIMIDEMLNLKVSDYWLLWIGIGLSALVLHFES
ncbi:7506_t:CDS:2, partial [Rhizophagus irregularis]